MKNSKQTKMAHILLIQLSNICKNNIRVIFSLLMDSGALKDYIVEIYLFFHDHCFCYCQLQLFPIDYDGQ